MLIRQLGTAAVGSWPQRVLLGLGSLGRELTPRLGQALPLLVGHLGILQVQRPDRGRDDVGDDGPGDPLVVGRDDVPGGPLGAGGRQAVRVRPHVPAPVGPLGQVGRGELPVLVRAVEPLEEPPLLLLLRHVQEELEDHRPVPDQVPLERVDVLVAPPPELLPELLARQPLRRQQLGVDLHDEDVLVVRPVEDPDPPPLGQAPHVPPEEVVVQVLGRRLLEAEDLAALGVDPGHDVLDRPVLAGRVHRLEDDQHRVPVVGVEQVLGLGQVREVLVEDLPGPLLQGVLAEFLHLLGLRPAGVVVLQPDRLAGGHAEQVDDVLANHGRPPRMTSPARGGGSLTGRLGPSAHRLDDRRLGGGRRRRRVRRRRPASAGSGRAGRVREPRSRSPRT